VTGANATPGPRDRGAPDRPGASLPDADGRAAAFPRARTWARRCLVAAALLAPVTSTLALRTGWWTRPALLLAMLQWLAVILTLGACLRDRGRRTRVLAGAALVLLAGLMVAIGVTGIGAYPVEWAPAGLEDTMRSLPAASHAGVGTGRGVTGGSAALLGLAAAAGGLHALCYGALLAWFGTSLLPRREPVVTGFARRLNPRFADDMRRYTRRVTWAWCLLFAAEIPASAGLLLWAPRWWPMFANFGHLLPVLALMLAEAAVRRWRFGARATGLGTMAAAIRSGAFNRPMHRRAAPDGGADRPDDPG
jgi:hypothetical protein